MHEIAHGGVRHRERTCTESSLWEENPLLHRGIEPASAACRSDALPTELHPIPSYSLQARYWNTGYLRYKVLFKRVGGCILACEDFGRMLDHSFPTCTFFKVETSSRTLILLCRPDQSTVAKRAETTVAECSLTSCV